MGSSKNLFCNLPVSLPGHCKYIRKYLQENENIFKNILGCCSVVLLIHEKNQSSKISCSLPFKKGSVLGRLPFFKCRWPSLFLGDVGAVSNARFAGVTMASFALPYSSGGVRGACGGFRGTCEGGGGEEKSSPFSHRSVPTQDFRGGILLLRVDWLNGSGAAESTVITALFFFPSS